MNRKMLILLVLIIKINFVNSQEFLIKEKREYRSYKINNVIGKKELKKVTAYNEAGQIISIIDVCRDSNCCFYNKPFILYSTKDVYFYIPKGNLESKVHYSCDSLPCYKYFINYKLDNKNRLFEEIEYEYNYLTDNKIYQNDEWVIAEIGDSTMHTITTERYRYNKLDSISKKKIIIEDVYPNKSKTSWNTKYKYDKKGNLKRVFKPFLGVFRFGEKYYYDEKNRVVKTTSNLFTINSSVDYIYDEKGNIFKTIKISNHDTTTTEFNYNNQGLILSENIKVNNSFTNYKYDYDSYGNLIRIEENQNNENFLITDYEYEFY